MLCVGIACQSQHEAAEKVCCLGLPLRCYENMTDSCTCIRLPGIRLPGRLVEIFSLSTACFW